MSILDEYDKRRKLHGDLAVNQFIEKVHNEKELKYTYEGEEYILISKKIS